MTSHPITGSTRLAGVIGHPVRYSLSPQMHNAAYQSLGIDAAYVALPVDPERLPDAIEAIRAFDMLGASVTIPHKEAVIPFLDELSPTAERLQAVNCIVNDAGYLTGHNTDGAGFVAALRDESDFDPSNRKCAVVGAGGAAKAIVAALAQAGASAVLVVNRTSDRAHAAASLAGDVGRVADVSELSDVDLVVNTTPLGMTGPNATTVPFDVSLIRSGQTVVDIVYVPQETLLLAGASARGARTANGLGMLIFQAVEQIVLWTGQRPSAGLMRSAAQNSSA